MEVDGAPRRRQQEAARLIGDLRGLGMKRRHISQIVGASESLLSRWYTGSRTPSAFQVQRLATLHRALTAPSVDGHAWKIGSPS